MSCVSRYILISQTLLVFIHMKFEMEIAYVWVKLRGVAFYQILVIESAHKEKSKLHKNQEVPNTGTDKHTPEQHNPPS